MFGSNELMYLSYFKELLQVSNNFLDPLRTLKLTIVQNAEYYPGSSRLRADHYMMYAAESILPYSTFSEVTKIWGTNVSSS
jgi:hypothetical protein